MPAEKAADEESRRITPRSARGVRTRAGLVQAAREIFERDGYLDARIADITERAGAASGSFYTYFEGKEEIFAAVVDVVQEEILHPHVRERTGLTDPRALIEAANREYLQAYRRNARLMALFEQVSQIDDNFRQQRLERSKVFAERNAKMIRRMQDSGAASPDLDPLVTAHALSAMVSRMAFLVFVLKYHIPFEQLVATLTQLWVNALQLKSDS